jgi:hypothetical protein
LKIDDEQGVMKEEGKRKEAGDEREYRISSKE